MMTSRSLYTVDTNVLIDLHRGNVLEKFFELPYQFVSPDVILEDELLEPSGASLIRLGLQRGELSGEEVLAVGKLYEHHSNIAVEDLFALMLALGRGLTLLTGDNNLRKLANKHNVKVHGTLWVLDEMVEKNILKSVEASRALHSMLEQGSRLPSHEYQDRFRKWSTK